MILPDTGTDDQLREAAMNALNVRHGCTPAGTVSWCPELTNNHHLSFRTALIEAVEFIRARDSRTAEMPTYLCCGSLSTTLLRMVPWFHERTHYPHQFGVLILDNGLTVALLEDDDLNHVEMSVVSGRYIVPITMSDKSGKKLGGVLYSRRPASTHNLPFFPRLWAYLKAAKWAFLGWSISFVVSLVTPGITKTTTWWVSQFLLLVAIGAFIVGILWFMDSAINRRRSK